MIQISIRLKGGDRGRSDLQFLVFVFDGDGIIQSEFIPPTGE